MPSAAEPTASAYQTQAALVFRSLFYDRTLPTDTTSPLVIGLAVTPGLLHQFAQRHRRPAWLARQLGPMARQQGHLARHHAQPGPARTAPGGSLFARIGGRGFCV